MKYTLRGASSAAIIVGLAGSIFTAHAQTAETVQLAQLAGPQEVTAATVEQTAPPPPPPAGERIVVTGSFIQGTPEDAALPVEVFSQEELEASGSPTALEFAKELTISGPTIGESNYFGGGNLTGSPNFNLRSLGVDKTLTLLNGRRMSENLSNIPAIALARTEVLKDGAATIYGADAVGGVVNFITRDDFVGIETTANYRYIADTDGEYKLGILGGFGEGDSNFLWAFEYEHRSRLEAEDRDFSSLSYEQNPSPWSPLTNLGTYVPRTAGGTALASLRDFTQPMCEGQGGVYDPAATGGVQCLFGYSSFYNLVEDMDTYRAFAQINSALSDTMNFHADVTYGQVLVPEQFASPSLPTTQGPAASAGATFQYRVPRANPYTTEFANRTGFSASPLYGAASYYDIILLRPLAHQGNPVGGRGEGYGNAASIDNQVWRVSASVDGELGPINYDFGVTYNQSISEYNESDILGFRLQDALNGFGGPNCSAADLDPTQPGIQNAAAAGKNGCLWYNPFSSSYPVQPELGLPNSNYVAGTDNPDELVGWLFGDRLIETTNNSVTYDLVFNGRLPFELPGGAPGWALGAQARQLELRELVPSNFYNGNIPCAYPEQQPGTYPGYTDCTTLGGTGPFTFYGTNTPDYYDQQSRSFFGELQLPVFDTVNVQMAVRNEEFSGGLSDTIYKASGKWDVFGPLSIRGSYGTNFVAPPISLDPGGVANIVRGYTRVNSAWLAAQEVTRTDVQPETAVAWNIGAIWQSQGFSSDHDLQIIVDYFNIETEGEIGQVVTPNEIANAIFRYNAAGVAFANQNGTAIAGQTAVNNGQARADCAHPLIGRLRLNDTATSPGGVCVQGSTIANDINLIQTEIGNGPGQTVAGVDVQIQYELPVGPGDLTLGANGTYMTDLTLSAKSLDGFEVAPADDRLGDLNFNSVTFASPELRANMFANYNMDQHNVRLTGRYVSGITDERVYANLTAYEPGTQTPIGEALNGQEIDASLIFDATYLFDITEWLRLSATVTNILDEDPPFVRAEFGYDPRLGVDALGRTFELGLKATF